MVALSAKAKRLQDIQGLLERLEAIKKEMPVERDGSRNTPSNGARNDAFSEKKSEFMQRLASVKRTIKEMREAETKVTTRTREQIAKQQYIRGELRELNRLLGEMDKILQKERLKRKSKMTTDEIQERSEFVRVVQAELARLKNASTKGYVGAPTTDGGDLEEGGGGGDNGSMFKTGMLFGGPGNASGVGDGIGAGKDIEMTEMQKKDLEQIKKRDEEFDNILDEIGAFVDRAKQQAEQIGETTKNQGIMIEDVIGNVEQAQAKLDSVNMRMKVSLENNGWGMERFCINFLCFIVLLGIVGVIVNIA